MATEQQWIVRYKHYVSPKVQSMHVANVKKLTADTAVPFSAVINEEASFSIGNETKGYLAKFDEITRVQLEALPEVCLSPPMIFPSQTHKCKVYEIEPLRYYKHVNVPQKDAPWGLARLNTNGPIKTESGHVYNYRPEANGTGVTAYIIDTGINEKHEDFEGRAKKGPTFVQEAPASGDADVDGHGTHVAGTIGGKKYGVAKKVSLVGIKVFDDEGSATTIDIIQALSWIVNDVHQSHIPKKAVVNLSLGGGASPAMDAAIASAVRQGVVVVVAAGNSNGNDPTFFAESWANAFLFRRC
jgi:subtilisin family serine protease